LFPGILIAQLDEPGISIKLQSRILGDFQSVSVLELQGLVPAILFKNARLHSHQIEIFSFGAIGNYGDKEPDGLNRGDFQMGIAYEYTVPTLAFNQNPQFELEAGLGTAIGISSYIIQPNSSDEYRTTGTSFLLDLYGIAVFRKYISARSFLELSPQFYVGEFGFKRAKTEDPSVAIRSQTTNVFSYRGHRFKKYAVRFGIGLTI
ncbi:MAG: hypothetical protein AAF696_32865, partial [Bacteroidota bacterium]